MTIEDLLSIPSTLKHKGKSYEIRPPTLIEQGKFSRWLIQNARDAIEVGYTSSEAKEKADNRLNRDIAGKVYAWEGEVCAEALQHREGLLKFLEIIGIPGAIAAEIIETRLRAIVQLIRGAQADDPKEVARAATTLGLPADFLKPRKSSSSGSATRRSTKRRRKSGR